MAPQVPIVQQKPVLTQSERILSVIAFCESTDRHFNPDGSVIRGIVDSRDIGRYLNNLDDHQETAESMGLDLFKEKDNETYAKHLYKTQGTQPWSASYKCMRKKGVNI